jgi:hypothetical protein
VYFTVIPVSFVKVSAVSFWMSSICGLPTISAVMVLSAESPLLPPVEPAPEQPAVNISSPTAARAIFLGMVEPPFYSKTAKGGIAFLDSDDLWAEPGIALRLGHRQCGVRDQ